MPPDLTPDQRKVIAANKHRTALYLLAASPPLRAVADNAAARVGSPRTASVGDRKESYGRLVRRITGDDPRRFEPEGSWCLAIVVDGHASWEGLLRLGRRVGIDGQSRIHFHLAEGLDSLSILDPWTALSSTIRFTHYRDPKNLVKHLLEQLNSQNLRDHAPGSVPGFQ